MYSSPSGFSFREALCVSHRGISTEGCPAEINHDQYQLQESLTETLTDSTPTILHIIRAVSKTQFPGTISLKEPCQLQHYLEDMFCMFLQTHCQTFQQCGGVSDTSVREHWTQGYPGIWESKISFP